MSRNIMKTIMIFLWALISLHCGEGDDRGARVVQNQSRLAMLTSTPSTALLYRVVPDETSVGYRTTPENLSGDLCYAILSLGDLGPGMYAMTWLAPPDSFPNGPHSGTCSTIEFDLSNPVTVSNSIVVPDSADNMPSNQIIGRAELNFNYVDATFQTSDDAPEYTIRTVYASSATAADVSGTMKKGDKLIRLPGESVFQWANPSGISAVRAEVAQELYSDATVTGYEFPGQGNPDYVSVTANFNEALEVTYDLITDTSQIWTLEFDLSDAIVWADDPASFIAPNEYVAGFRLKFGPNQSTTMGEDDDGIRAQLRIENGEIQ